MPGFFANKLTEKSDHLVDWSRVAELATTKHRYSRDEILIRACIVGFTAASAYAGWYLNRQRDPEKRMSGTSASILSSVIGFTVSHAVAIWPLIKKRIQARKDALTLSAKLIFNIETQEFDDLNCRQKLRGLVADIMQLSLSDEKHSNASMTWGRRINLLKSLHAYLELGEIDESYYLQTPSQQIIKHLHESPKPCDCGIEYKTPPYR